MGSACSSKSAQARTAASILGAVTPIRISALTFSTILGASGSNGIFLS